MPQRRGLCWSAADVGDTRTRIVPSASPLGTADITPPGQMHGAAVTIFHPKITCCAGGGNPLCRRIPRYLGEEGKTLGALKITHNCLRM